MLKKLFVCAPVREAIVAYLGHELWKIRVEDRIGDSLKNFRRVGFGIRGHTHPTLEEVDECIRRIKCPRFESENNRITEDVCEILQSDVYYTDVLRVSDETVTFFDHVLYDVLSKIEMHTRSGYGVIRLNIQAKKNSPVKFTWVMNSTVVY